MKHISVRLLLFFFVLYIYGCKSTRPEIERGDTYEFQLGHPEIRISTLGVIDEDDQPILKIATEVIYSSLISKFRDRKRFSEIRIDYSITELKSGFNTTFHKEFLLESTPQNISGESFTIQEDVVVVPGEYEIFVTVRDLSSGKESTRKADTFIPDPAKPSVNVTNIQLSGKDNDIAEEGFFPITTYDVPSRMDSLRFVFQVTNSEEKNPLTVKSRLIRYEADTTAAWPMNYRQYPVSSLKYQGIEMDAVEEITSGTRVLTQSGSIFIEFSYPAFRRGNYRFEVDILLGDKISSKKTRDFAIKSTNYPTIKTVQEFAAPLRYLMEDKEYEELISIRDNKKLKNAVDKFWLSNIENTSTARSVIELYYNRVEEANKLFSTYKEGWKTDRGMMYILFGEPWYVNQDLNLLSWGYSYNAENPDKNFDFFAPRLQNRFYPFENYILKRSGDYYSLYYQRINLWLSGNILTSNL